MVREGIGGSTRLGVGEDLLFICGSDREGRTDEVVGGNAGIEHPAAAAFGETVEGALYA